MCESINRVRIKKCIKTKAKRNTVWWHLLAVRDKSKSMKINHLQRFDKNNAQKYNEKSN